MRAALILVLMAGAVFAASAAPIPLPSEVRTGQWRMLDKSPRARTYAISYTIPVTEAEFRKMQQRYRPQDFDMWAKRLRQLRRGMPEKEVVHVLQPKTMGAQVTSGSMVWNTIILDDAYFAAVFIEPHTDRMISATPPLAMTYEVKPDQKRRPKA